MRESTEVLLVPADQRYADSVERAIEMHDTSAAAPIQAGIAAAVEMAEMDPEWAREALWKLQSDWDALERLAARLGGEPTRAALRVGGAIQMARAELGSPAPRFDDLLPEILGWLECEE